MARLRRFTFICDSDERRVLALLAYRLQRSQSDSVRWLISEEARKLGVTDVQTQHTPNQLPIHAESGEANHATYPA